MENFEKNAIIILIGGVNKDRIGNPSKDAPVHFHWFSVFLFFWSWRSYHDWFMDLKSKNRFFRFRRSYLMFKNKSKSKKVLGSGSSENDHFRLEIAYFSLIFLLFSTRGRLLKIVQSSSKIVQSSSAITTKTKTKTQREEKRKRKTKRKKRKKRKRQTTRRRRETEGQDPDSDIKDGARRP